VPVAVGLAAIRPLKLENDILKNTMDFGCSGFGRYQAVETVQHVLNRPEGLCCSGFGRYQAVETRCRTAISHGFLVAVGLAAIRPLKPVQTCRSKTRRLALQWVWPLSGR